MNRPGGSQEPPFFLCAACACVPFGRARASVSRIRDAAHGERHAAGAASDSRRYPDVTEPTGRGQLLAESRWILDPGRSIRHSHQIASDALPPHPLPQPGY